MIIPLTEKMGRQNPPIITIALIVSNCLVFFMFSSGDNERLSSAWEYYVNSPMAKVEVERFLQYLETTGQQEEAEGLHSLNLDKQNGIFIAGKMIENDPDFYKSLHDGKIISGKDDFYDQWQEFRKEFDHRMAGVVSLEYGYRPAFGKLRNAFTSIFLHGGIDHLLGNMIFLWLVGCMLEMVVPRALFLLGYLASGIIATYTFAAFNSTSGIPLVGASGAISGMMGAYALIYGSRKVTVFLMLGFYFDKMKVPAALLFPFWVGQEFYQLFFGGASYVAYLAHIGGLLSGGLMGWFLKRWKRQEIENLVNPVDIRKEVDALLEEGLQAFAALDITTARSCIEKVLEREKNNQQALKHLFHIEKTEPRSERFHQSADRLLSILGRSKVQQEEMLKCFQEYNRLAKQNSLCPEVNGLVLTACCEKGAMDEARKVMAHLLQKAVDHEQTPQGLLRLTKAYLAGKKHDNARECLKILQARYPQSKESEIAATFRFVSS